jgi:DNA-binding NtrC family response regulator
VRLSEAARTALHGHDWPGNVRELRNCIEAAVVLTPSSEIAPDVLTLGPSTAGRSEQFQSGPAALAQVELAYIRWMLEQCDGNRSEAARRLGIGRNTLLRKLRGDTEP